MRVTQAVVVFTIVFSIKTTIAAEQTLRKGEVEFQPAANEEIVPEHFRMQTHRFAFQQEFSELASSPSVRFSKVTFPSPVKTPDEANNTVHCEYFLPVAKGQTENGKVEKGPRKVPGVVVLHILGGDFFLARIFCQHLANRGVAALFLKMPYYGPRREPGSGKRMVSENPQETVAGMKQAVLDIRRAGAWLSAQPEVDAQQLGIMGISLGGIVSALASEAEPRFGKVALLLAGGDISRVAWESPQLDRVRRKWLAGGGTRESLVELVAPIDPVTYAKNLHGRKVLMLNAAHDEIIPRACTDSLWNALGQPEIQWWDAGHISAARHLLEGLDRVSKLFEDPKK